MKNTFKFIMAVVIAGSSLFYSCETTELELVNDPNNLTSDQADPNFLLNSVQLSYQLNAQTFNGNGGALTRVQYFGDRNYFAGLTGGTLDGAWSRTYAGMLVDVRTIEELDADPSIDLRFQVGTGKIMLGHSLLWLVDYIGDIPFDEAFNPIDFPSPNVQDGASVYEAAINLVAEGRAALAALNADLIASEGDVNSAIEDLFYDEDISKWIKASNTIEMKAAITTGDLATFNAIVAGDNFISETEDDLQLQFGSNLLNPDTRHPDYQQDYTPSGGNLYRSNWLMNYMSETNDPRMTYYFYRQSDCTPGASCLPEGNGETLSCSLETSPPHYAGFTYCFLENGYWGRDHGDDDGTPPDNFLRTVTGVYPSGGLYDQGEFESVSLGAGGGGAGIEPIILASYVDFWRAEAALIAGDADGAADFIEAGLIKSIAKVQSFGALDATNDGSTEPSSVVVDNFISDIIADFDAADMTGKWNVYAQQYWVTLYGGAAESYNFYRRQGFPTTLQPNLEADPGNFPRSFPYASSEVIANPNINQKPDQNTQVFWDTNPPSSPNGGFPASN
ncbi:SusD/RagB family nutrient-binding outer membrane lipoprotein [uncultured Dokdonia sp.]|uniref:SusD/RagB family nutrient-binding outer membrane lipoprotein n=1 Tax=uncultured Dokdonia sp. TaxID=575653 RepID=UPI002608E177|nr:SusD/RagB family nutrient-binding outer membrane lipoprotein [uncultured Dokdonia sp.]